jgi:hypothetical protein
VKAVKDMEDGQRQQKTVHALIHGCEAIAGNRNDIHKTEE